MRLRHRHSRPAVALALVVTLALAGCTSGDPVVDKPAATVNGVDIPSSQLIEVTRAALEVPDDATSLATAESAQLLDLLIQIELVRQWAEDEGIEITEDDRQEALDRLYEQFGQDPGTGVVDPEAGKAAFEELDPVLQEVSLDREVLATRLAASITDEDAGIDPVTDAEVQSAFEDAAPGLVRRCVSFLQADPTDGDLDAQAAAAQEIFERLEAGTPVDELVDEVNEGQDPNLPLAGELPCSTEAEMQQQVQSGGLPPDIAEAIWGAEGEGPIEPLVVQGAGAIVLVVVSEEIPTLADVEEQLRGELESANDNLRDQATGRVVAELALEADVWVDARYGRWVDVDETGVETDDPEAAVGAGVAPPEGPQDAPVDPDDSLPVDPLGGIPTAP